jgi:hypothetical protein
MSILLTLHPFIPFPYFSSSSSPSFLISDSFEFLYHLGHVFYWMTALPNQSTRFTSRQNDSIRKFRSAILRCDEFLPAFLQLLEPVLDVSLPVKTPHQAKAVLIVFGLFTNLLNVPIRGGGTIKVAGGAGAAAPRGSASAANSGAADRDELIRQFHSSNVIPLACSVSRLVGNERFKEQAISLLDFWFHLVKGSSASDLVLANKRTVANALEMKAKVQAVAAALAASKKSSGGLSGAPPLSNQAAQQAAHVAPSLVTPVLATKKTLSSTTDPLMLSRLMERRTAEASRGATDLNRHSRFGTKLFLSDGLSRQLAPSLVTAPGAKDTAQHIVKRGARASSSGGVSKKDKGDGEGGLGGGGEDDEEVLTVRRDSLTDVFKGSGSQGSGGLSGGLINTSIDSSRDRILNILFEGVTSLVQQSQGGSEESDKGDMTTTAASSSSAGAGGEEEEEDMSSSSTLTYISGFSSLVSAIKARFARDEGTPEDRLRYFHVTSVAMGCYRAKQLGISKKSKFNATPILKCLDSWSFRHLMACLEDYISRKQWFAVETAASHLKEIILTVYAMLENGDADSLDTGLQLYGYEMPEAQNQIPRLLKLFDPYRFHPSFAADLIESAHYLLKLSDKSAQEGGMRAAMDTSAVDGGIKKKKSGRSDEDAFSAQFAHPTVIQCYLFALKSCLINTDKLNYYACHFLRRLTTIPNDAAGTDPRNEHKPFTFASMLFNVSTVALAEQILTHPGVLASRTCKDVVHWASNFSSSFLSAAKENPLLFVEALFWRHEKGANADVSTHYGIATGHVSRAEDGTSDLLFGGLKKKKKSKAALAIDEAEFEARKNRLYAEQKRKEREAAFGVLEGDAAAAADVEADASTVVRKRVHDIDDGEAQLNFDDDDDDGDGDGETRRKRSKSSLKRKRNKLSKTRGDDSSGNDDNTGVADSGSGEGEGGETATTTETTDDDEGFHRRKRKPKRSSKRGGGGLLKRRTPKIKLRLLRRSAVDDDEDKAGSSSSSSASSKSSSDNDDSESSPSGKSSGSENEEENGSKQREGLSSSSSSSSSSSTSAMLTMMNMANSDDEDDDNDGALTSTAAALRAFDAAETAREASKTSLSKASGARRHMLAFEEEDEVDDIEKSMIPVTKEFIMALRRKEAASKLSSL